MNRVIQYFLENLPHLIVILVVLLSAGIFSISRIPIQLFPNLERPALSVVTSWRAASPSEIESEIIAPIEKELRGISSLRSMQSISAYGRGAVRLEFDLNSNMDIAFSEVASRLQRIRNLPLDSDRPQIRRNGGATADETLIALFLQRLPGYSDDGQELTQFAIDHLSPKLEEIEGVGAVEINSIYGEKSLKITVDPFKAANFNISIEELSNVINRSRDVTGGAIKFGGNDYTLRYEGQFDLENLESFIIAFEEGSPIFLRDIATVELIAEKGRGYAYQNGNPAIGIRVIKSSQANTLKTINLINSSIERLNKNDLKNRGYMISKSFDPSVFIKRSLIFVVINLTLGITITTVVLFFFLRNLRVTLMVISAIPLCLILTVIILYLTGQSINVISLAGLAFSVGLVLDAAIIVVDNEVYFKTTREGTSSSLSAVERVFSALFASTVTTIAIFLPIVFFDDVEGQIFSDLAVTISAAVFVSFLISVTIIPVGCHFILDNKFLEGNWQKSKLQSPLVSFIGRVSGSTVKQIGLIIFFVLGPITLIYTYQPKLDYLPTLKQDAITASIVSSGYTNIEIVNEEMASIVIKRLKPYLENKKKPYIDNYYLFLTSAGSTLGVRPENSEEVSDIAQILRQEIIADLPSVRSFVRQGDLLRNLSGGASFQIHLHSNSQKEIIDTLPEIIHKLKNTFDGVSVRPYPNPNQQIPEIIIEPIDRRLMEMGVRRESLGRFIRALGNGVWLGETFWEGKRINVLLTMDGNFDSNIIEDLPVVTPSNETLPLGQLVEIKTGSSPSQIQRIDSLRTISLRINTVDDVPIGEIISVLQQNIETEILSLLPSKSTITYHGQIDGLQRAIKNLLLNFIFAIILLFLIIAAILKSALNSLLVVITIPLATFGGLVGLNILNVFHSTPLDLLGMVGFIILLGLVVNNSILIIAQADFYYKQGVSVNESVNRAINIRFRPIMMTSITTIFGMLPLAVSFGAGSAIYRGLACILVGGMLFSMLFTLLLLPALIKISWDNIRTDLKTK